MSGRRGTPQQIAEAQTMRDRGMSYKRIGDLLGFTDCAVHRWLNERKRSGPAKPKSKPSPSRPAVVVNPAAAAEIRRLHRKGLGRTEIAALTGAKYAEIEEALK